MSDGLPKHLTVEWMQDARNSDAMLAIHEGLCRQAYVIREREESFIRRHPGAKWDENAERDYRELTAAASFFMELYLGFRGVAVEVAKANKKTGSTRHWMPEWITTIGDRLRIAFCAPLPKLEEKTHDARMENVA